MNRTPLIRPLRDNGATMYVFPSAAEDIGLNIDNRVNNVALSHYALLNFKDQDADTYASDLQNYVMNCECTLLNQTNYNYQEYHTVSERVFWHWAIDRKHYVEFESYTNQTTSSGDPLKDYYIQLQKADPDRFVQCFGSIDAGNSLSTEFGMFNETYINIPTSYGNGPVFFNTKAQDIGEQNCVAGNQYSATQPDGKLEGRTQEQLDDLAIIDSEPVYDSTNAEGGVYEIGYADGRHTKKAYEIVKDFNLIQTACNEHFNAGKTGDNRDDYIINSYDDVNVDTKRQFKDEYDITSKKCEFEFNAILLYYSVYDQDDPTKSAYAINLFGIIFLNGPISGIIPTLTKRKSFGSEHTNFFGNSYSFRVNLKTMSVYDNTDAIINDNTTMTSIYGSDFSDVVSNLNRAIDAMNTNVQSTMAIQDSYMRILRNNDETREYVENISTKINALVNGSKTSALPVNRLCVNEIMPEDDEKNMVKITLNRRYSDYIDTSNYQARPTVSPIIVRNDYDDFNIPTMYMPSISISSVAEGTLTGVDIDILNDIIDNTSVLYYRYDTMCVANMTLPETEIKDLGIQNLYTVLNEEDYTPDFDQDLQVDTSISYVNYNGLIPLMILYIQNLKKEIELLKQQLNP